MAEPTPPDTVTETKTVTSADGTEIAYERTGSGPPLVLVHGGGTDRGFWERSDVRPALADLPPEAIAATRSDSNWEHDVEGARTLPRQLRAVGEYAFDASRFTDVSTTTLLLSGSESLPLVSDATDAVADALPDSRIVVFDGHEHEAMFTATDHFLEEVLAFVSETN